MGYNKDGKVEMAIDSTASETNNNLALAGFTKALPEPGRPTPALGVLGPSRDVS